MIKDLDELIQAGVDEGVFPGANYCLIKEGHVTFNSFGYKALYPVTEENALDTIYDIASLSKVIGTTTAVLKLCEEGRLTLDDKISHYLPYIKYNHITIRDLLLHRSGYPALTEGTTEMTTAGPLIKDLEACELTYETGSKVVYSDVGFMYLGFLVDHMTGSMEKYLEGNVFKPLEMVDTKYNHKEIKRIAPTEEFGFRGMIRGFVHDEKAFLLNGIAGHAGLYSTVQDLAHFAQMILNNGTYKGQTILSSETIEKMSEEIEPYDGDYRSLGWIIKEHQILYHTGYTGTHILIDQSKQQAFILLSNRVHPTRENTKIIKFRKRIEALLYGEI